MTDILTATAQRAALVAYYEIERAIAQTQADEMHVMGRTVRLLSDAQVADEYHSLVGGSSTGIPHGNAR